MTAFCHLLAAAYGDEISTCPQGLLLVARGPHENGAVFGPHMRGSRLRASAAGDEEVDLVLPGNPRFLSAFFFLLPP